MENTQVAIGLRTLFSVLGALMVATLLYSLFTHGSPFRIELLTPWLVATLIDLYIHVFILAVWVAYKESNWISSILWIIFLICLGSITACAYIVVQFLKLSSQESSQDPMYYVLLRHPNKIGTEPKRKHSSVVLVTLGVLFGILGVFLLAAVVYASVIDGSPLRADVITPWVGAALVNFYINAVTIAVWFAYKESSWISVILLVIPLTAFGSTITCSYLVWQLFQISSQDPVYLILVRHGDREEDKYKGLLEAAT